MKELKKLSVLSFGKVFAVFGFIFALLQMIILKIVNSVDPTFLPTYGISNAGLTFVGMLMSVILATILWFLVGMLVALVYNLAAKYFGGIKYNAEENFPKVKRRKKK